MCQTLAPPRFQWIRDSMYSRIILVLFLYYSRIILVLFPSNSRIFPYYSRIIPVNFSYFLVQYAKKSKKSKIDRKSLLRPPPRPEFCVDYKSGVETQHFHCKNKCV